MNLQPPTILLILALLAISTGLLTLNGVSATTFTFTNKCTYTVWPGILPNFNSPKLTSTGFELSPSSSRSFQSPAGFSGRFWGRTHCISDTDPTSLTPFYCSTGDCGSGEVECNEMGATPPVTLAEFTLNGGDGLDFYDVSLVDGYNVPVIIEVTGGSGACGSTGCVADLNSNCPSELKAENGGACKSACMAFGSPEYCCSGAFSTPDTCRPSVYSEMFKTACPKSYSYAYDDAISTFTCSGADYTLTFCPNYPRYIEPLLTFFLSLKFFKSYNTVAIGEFSSVYIFCNQKSLTDTAPSLVTSPNKEEASDVAGSGGGGDGSGVEWWQMGHG